MKQKRHEFQLDFKTHEFPELSAEIVDGIGRLYTTPSGNKYPSVTTILGKATDQSWLADWIARVGKEEADRVSRTAARRGTAVHELVEKYLRNDPDYLKGQMPFNIQSFKNIQPFLDAHLSTIYGLEVPLYSDQLRVAGRVDCIGIWDGVFSIIDFKTSRKPKTKADIPNYFLQESAYAYMFFEHTGVPVPQLVTVMTVDQGESLVFLERTRDWIGGFIELRNSVDL